MKPLLLIATLTLAACGADGPPTPPTKAESGLSITGSVRIGTVLK